MDVDQRVAYTQRIMIGAALKKYKEVLMDCKPLEKDLTGEKWNLRNLKALSTEDSWNWSKSDGLDYSSDAYLIWTSMLTSRRRFFLSWESACRGSTEDSFRTT